MMLDELIQKLTAIRDRQSRTWEVLVVTQDQGGVGATPAQRIESVEAGFDWDAGRVLLRPAQPVVALTPEQIADIRTSVRRGGSWHAYQAHKRQAEEIQALRGKVTRLRSFADLVKRGVESGSIRANPIIDDDPTSELLELRSLSQVAGDVLQATGGSEPSVNT